MAGIFITFVIEFVSHRIAGGHSHDIPGTLSPSSGNDKSATTDTERVVTEGSSGRNLVINTAVIEAGIIFHSIRKC